MKCPCCGYETDPEAHEVDPAVTAADLERDCRARGHAVYPGGRVPEPVAAAILGVASGTLRNWRSSGRGPAFLRAGGGRGRVSYRLEDLAAFLEFGE